VTTIASFGFVNFLAADKGSSTAPTGFLLELASPLPAHKCGCMFNISDTAAPETQRIE
jgi:hypothetical protein